MLPGGWVTLRDVYRCAIDKALFAKKIQQAQAYAADISDEWISLAATEIAGDHLTPLRVFGFQPDPADLSRFQARAEPAASAAVATAAPIPLPGARGTGRAHVPHRTPHHAHA